MSYITTADLATRIGAERLTRLVNDPANQTTILADVIARAEAVVDGYLASVYTVPVAANALVQGWALDIAEWELARRGAGPEVQEKVRQAYDDALRALRDVAAGKLTISGATTTAAASTAGIIAIETSTAVFDASSMEDGGW